MRKTVRQRLTAGIAACAAIAAGLSLAPQAGASTTPTAAPKTQAAAAPADSADPNLTSPYMGWSSWSLQATNYPGYNPEGGSSYLNEANILKQANALVSSGLTKAGYKYVNIDALWYADIGHHVKLDQYGRVTPDAGRFPNGMKSVADKIHALGLKAGIYTYAGLQKEAYDADAPIYNTQHDCTTKDAALKDSSGNPVVSPSGWNNTYVLDYSSDNPCGYEYTYSLAKQFKDWGYDLLKLDAVTPSGTSGAVSDLTKSGYYEVANWRKAFDTLGWKGHFELSWSVHRDHADYWKQHTSGVRIDGDVECYCDKLTGWSYINSRFKDLPGWVSHVGNGFFPNLDSLLVGNGEMDGLSQDERRTATTFWAMATSPLYSGDDLTKLDSFGKSLLTNNEVIAQNQAGRPAKPVSQTSNQQVWYVKNSDGTYTVALYNLDDSAKKVTANWGDIGLGTTQQASVRDLWSKSDLGNSAGSFAADLPAHGSRLIKIDPDTAGGPIKATASGKCVDVNGSSTADGAAVSLYTCNGDDNQVFTHNGTLKALGKCLDVAGGTDNGARILLWSCNGGSNQNWVTAADGTLRNPASGRCLDAAGGGTADGTRLVIWDCTGGSNQRWMYSS
ncbi:RICIN domain-containing protein [Streptomyces sp. NPDC002746]